VNWYIVGVFSRRFREQEQATTNQDEIPSGDGAPQDKKKRSRQPDDPDNGQQEQDAHYHRGQQSSPTSPALLRRRKIFDRIEMKMTLSTPSTISRNVNVMSATRLEEVNNASIVTALPLD
jgi:hypothetical protein